ncbi:hypothetical protein BWK59_02520 [Flavobacterium davisii]|uniref:Uncharacterized protein n=1 Tax=Flavobacterium davisii TaxID=2906077 RepID=A0A246GMN8_9FLAO|nr:hypothetical protein [Flavobacterium davisii]OWP84996.1 hypothetical protein BWK59_02520 [Flavobacterium davisii]
MFLEEEEEEERIIDICGVKVSNKDYSIDYLTNKNIGVYKIGINTDEERELKKLFYLNDKKERLRKLNQWIDEDKNDKEIMLYRGDSVIRSLKEDLEEEEIFIQIRLNIDFQICQYESYIRKFGNDFSSLFLRSCLDNYSAFDLFELDKIIEIEKEECKEIGLDKDLFRNIDGREEIRRIWMLEIYIEEIIETFSNIYKNDKYEGICYLIDEQYKVHKNVVSCLLEDVFIRAHVNYIIFEALEIHLKSIDDISTEKAQEFIYKRKYKKKSSLKWNANKNSLGTIFGVLHDAGIIQGNKTELARELANMFNNLSETTLIDNIGLKTDKKNSKPKYDTKTEDLLFDWIAFLKSCTPNEG